MEVSAETLHASYRSSHSYHQIWQTSTSTRQKDLAHALSAMQRTKTRACCWRPWHIREWWEYS